MLFTYNDVILCNNTRNMKIKDYSNDVYVLQLSVFVKTETSLVHYYILYTKVHGFFDTCM